MTARRTALALVGIVAVAAAFRVASSGGFWIDEVFSAANAKAGPSTFLERLRVEPHSPWPIYYLLLGWWQRVFPTVEGMKALSILLSVAQVLVLYGAGRSLFDRRAGLLAALLAAANPLRAWYGGEIRMYALMLLLLTGALWAAVVAARTRHALHGALFGLLAGLAVYAHVFAAFAVIVLTAFVVVRGGRRAALATLAVGVLLAAPAAWIAAGQAEHWLDWKGESAGSAYVSSPFNLAAALQSFFVAYAVPLEGTSGARLGVGVVLLWLVGVPTILVLLRRIPGRRLLAILVVAGIVLPWLVLLRTRMFSPRFALTALPPLLLLIAAALTGLPRLPRIGFVAGLVLLGGAAVIGGAGRTDWRDVADLLEKERRPDHSFSFEGGNVVALEEWFGDCFAETVLESTETVWSDHWMVGFSADASPEPWQHRKWRFGPEHRLVEDEAPTVYLVRYRERR